MAARRLFSQRVGYAVHALCCMAKMPAHAAIPVSDLRLWMCRFWPHTSAAYLSKVVQALVHGGILVSLRGSAGGYRFARPPALLSLLDIVTALEGRLAPHCPLIPTGPCTAAGRCENGRRLNRLQHEVASLLAQVTIQQLADDMPDPADAACGSFVVESEQIGPNISSTTPDPFLPSPLPSQDITAARCQPSACAP